MRIRSIICGLSLPAVVPLGAWAQEAGETAQEAAEQAGAAPEPAQEAQEREQAREHVFGWELMTDDEFAEHRAEMRAAQTREERQRLRYEQHAEMEKRAKQQGVALIGPGLGPPPHAGMEGEEPPGVGAGPGGKAKGQAEGQGGRGKGPGADMGRGPQAGGREPGR